MKYLRTSKHLLKTKWLSIEGLTFRSDQGGEYMSGDFRAFLKSNGIIHQQTVSFSPQQNGVAERKNRIIMELVRSMLKTKRLSQSFWGEAAASACYVLNRAATKAVHEKTPEEAWSGNKPCVSHLRIFGSLGYSHIPKEKRGKLDDKSEKCIFVGYSENSRAYKLFNPITKRIIISRDVIFDENAAWDWKNEKENGTIIYNNTLLESLEGETMPDQDEVSPQSSPESSSSSESPPRKTKSLAEIYGQTRRMLEEEFSDFALFVDSDPINFDDAEKEEKWRLAMKEEIDAINKNQTWDLVELPAGKKCIGVKWIYKTKRNAQGEIEKHKARLVVKGYKQQYGIDYQDVFVPVARLETIRLILALAAQNNWSVFRWT